MATATYAEVSWERMSNAVEKVRQRLLRAARTLDEAKIPYAVAGAMLWPRGFRAWMNGGAQYAGRGHYFAARRSACGAQRS